MYRVTLVSKDNQKFFFDTDKETEDAAIEAAKQRIVDNGWDHYQYEFKDIVKLHKAIN